jgi:glycosyltransferase involved in cell wall biosynthesis
MRIGHVLAHFPEPGGTTTMVLGLSAGLVDVGHDVVVYGYGSDSSGRSGSAVTEVLRRSDEIGIVNRVFSGRPGPLASLFNRSDDLTAWVASNRDDLDVLVIHGAFSASSPGVSRAADHGGMVRIACPHDPYSPAIFGTRRLVKRAYWRLVEAPFLRSMDGIHLLAPSHERYLNALGVAVPTFVVANGLDHRSIGTRGEDAAMVQPRPGAQGPLRLLYFGRWDVYNKGLDLLLTSIAKVRGHGVSIRLDIAGRATEVELTRLRRLASSLDLHDEVSVLGFVPDISGAIRGADAVVLPSRFDGFGQVVLESLALGTPVLASSKAGAAEYLGEEDGVLVAEPDVASLVTSLYELHRSRSRFRVAAYAGRGRLLDEFSWSRLARCWADHVSDIMSRRRA